MNIISKRGLFLFVLLILVVGLLGCRDGYDFEEFDVYVTEAIQEYMEDPDSLSDEKVEAVFKLIENFEGDKNLTRGERVALNSLKWELETLLMMREVEDFALAGSQELFMMERELIDNLNRCECGCGNSLDCECDCIEPVEVFSNYLDQAQEKVDEMLERLDELAQKGMLYPQYVIEHTIALYRNRLFFQGTPEYDEIFLAFDEKLEEFDMDEEEKARVREELLVRFQEVIYPNYRRLAEGLEEVKHLAPREGGLWQYPGGEEFYRYQLRWASSLDISPGELHDQALAQVDLLLEEIDVLAKEMGLEYEDNINSYLNYEEVEFFYFKDQVFDRYETLLSELEEFSKDLFYNFPERELVLEDVRGASYAAAYRYGEEDDEEAKFFFNLDILPIDLYFLVDLGVHEAIPGHHLQLGLEQESEEIPEFMKYLYFTAYIEGWATYAQRLPGEFGFYDREDLEMYFLIKQLNLMNRVVIDTGIHYHGWDRTEVNNYLSSVTGWYMNTNDSISTLFNNSHSISYGVGYLKILELREMAQEALGDDFDIRDFHDLILMYGSMPLEVLENLVIEYIEE